jgi:hypothetical protein
MNEFYQTILTQISTCDLNRKVGRRNEVDNYEQSTINKNGVRLMKSGNATTTNRNRESQLRWAGHVLRMGGDRIAWKVFEAKAQGGRPVGRPRQTWEEQMSTVMAERGINWREARIVAQDRSRWRRFYRSLDTAR